MKKEDSGRYLFRHIFRKKFLKAGACIGTLALALSLMPPVSAAAASKGASKTQLYTIEGGYPSTNSASKVISYDIAGGSAPEKIKFAFHQKNIKVYVNGKRKLTVNFDYYDSYTQVQFFRLANGKRFMFLKTTGDNADGIYALYRCSGGKFKRMLSQNSVVSKGANHRYIDNIFVKGNRVYVTYGHMFTLSGYTQFRYTYRYSGGKLRRTSSNTKQVNIAYQTRPTLTTAARVKLYRSKSTGARYSTVAKGTRVKVLAAGSAGKRFWLKVKTLNGNKTGWIRCKDSYYPNGHAGTLFKETGLAG